MADHVPMRLALVGPFAPFRGGIAQFNDRLHAELTRRGHATLPVTFSRQYPQLLFPGTSQMDPSRSGQALRLIDSLNPLTWRKAGERIREFKPDAVVAAYWTPHLSPALSGVVRRAKKQSSDDGGDPRRSTTAIGLIHNALPHGHVPFSRHLARRFLNRIDAAVTLSEAVEAEVRSLGFRGPVQTHPHPVYDHFGDPVDRGHARQRLGLPQNAPVLLCLGLVRAYKGFELAVRALPMIRERYPEARLIVAGEAYESSLDNLVEETHPAGLIRENRYIPDAEVPLYYSASDLLVLPYRSGTQSGALAAAAHFGLPVVVTDIPGLAGPVRQFGMGRVADAPEPAAVSTAVLEALDPVRHAALRQGARAMASTLTWASLAAEIEALASA